MLKFLKKWLLYYHWKSNIKIITNNNISIMHRSIMAAKMFNEDNKPIVALRVCNSFYITPTIHSLHMMLSELSRYVNEFKNYGKISPHSDTGKPEKIRVDKWCVSHLESIPRYKGKDIYQGYMIACELIKELNSLIKTDNQEKYIDRKCKKALSTFILLTELLGYIRYEIEYNKIGTNK